MLKSHLRKLIIFWKEKGKASLYWCDWFSVAHLPYYLCTDTMSTMFVVCLHYAYHACTIPTMPVLPLFITNLSFGVFVHHSHTTVILAE